MGILTKLKKLGTYKALVKCPNCNFNSGIKVSKGVSVADFVKGGKCTCDNCQVVFFPTEYTTEQFEKEKLQEKNKDMAIKLIKPLPKQKKEDNLW